MKQNKGIAQVAVMIVMLVLAVALPLTTSLVKKSQENRSRAASISDGKCWDNYNSLREFGTKWCEGVGKGEKVYLYECVAGGPNLIQYCSIEDKKVEGDCKLYCGEYVSGNNNDNNTGGGGGGTSIVKDDSACVNAGGLCWDGWANGQGKAGDACSFGSPEKIGILTGGKCLSNSDPKYLCCVPNSGTTDNTPTENTPVEPVVVAEVCGNGKVEGKEECDGSADECLSSSQGLVYKKATCNDRCTCEFLPQDRKVDEKTGALFRTFYIYDGLECKSVIYASELTCGEENKGGCYGSLDICMAANPTTVATSSSVNCMMCSNGKSRTSGDANCDGVVNGLDYSIWRQEFIDKQQSTLGGVKGWWASFNCVEVDSNTWATSLSNYTTWNTNRSK